LIEFFCGFPILKGEEAKFGIESSQHSPPFKKGRAGGIFGKSFSNC
jgi:hypothetical protein